MGQDLKPTGRRECYKGNYGVASESGLQSERLDCVEKKGAGASTHVEASLSKPQLFMRVRHRFTHVTVTLPATPPAGQAFNNASVADITTALTAMSAEDAALAACAKLLRCL